MATNRLRTKEENIAYVNSIRGRSKESGWRKLRRSILERDGYTCQLCGAKGTGSVFDKGRCMLAHHVVEQSKGGSDDPSNLMTICRKCHAKLHPRPNKKS